MMGVDQISAQIATFAYLAMFGILVISAMGVPIPEEPVLLASGLAVGWGKADFMLAAVACVLGILVGDIFVYTMSRYHAEKFLRLPPFRWIFTSACQARIARLYQRHGGKTLFFGRFLPAIRFGVLVFAGQNRMAWRQFLALDILAASLSGPLTIFIGYLAARQFADAAAATQWAEDLLAQGQHGIWLGIALLIAGLIARSFLSRRPGNTARSESVTPETCLPG
jgi:membrane protein DedA with SNARE-associated domain